MEGVDVSVIGWDYVYMFNVIVVFKCNDVFFNFVFKWNIFIIISC